MASSPSGLIHRLFGLEMASAFPFVSRLGAGTGPPDLTFACGREAPPGAAAQVGPPVYASPERTPQGESLTYLFRRPGCDLLRFSEVADFHLADDRVDCHLLDPRYEFLVELRLLGPVLAYWLERRALPALHASAVVVDGRAAAFLAGRCAGKSVLAAALMTAGHPLLADDLLAVEPAPAGCFLGRPGYPQMRLEPDAADRFLGGRHTLPRVHPDYAKRRVPVGPDGLGAFAALSHPLAAVYLPERLDGADGDRVRIAPLAPRDAVIELTRRSFIPRLAAAAGWQARRLETFSRLAERVPLRRLLYPAGFEQLPRVRDAVLADLAG